MSMQVILKNEVHNLGLPGDVVTVADGYGRNYLIPQGYALRATPGAMKEAEALTRSRLVQEAKTIGDAQAQAEAIESRTLRVPVRVDESGNLYGSVAVADVQKVLKERGFDVDKRRIDLKGAIKRIGTYEIPVQVHPQVVATVTLDVVDAEGKVGVDPVEPEVEASADADADADSIEEAALAAADEIDGTEADEAGEGDAPAADAVEENPEAQADEA